MSCCEIKRGGVTMVRTPLGKGRTGSVPLRAFSLTPNEISTRREALTGRRVEMQVSCPRCSRSLEYSGEPPSFCAYCGLSLTAQGSSTDGELQPALAATAYHTPAETSAEGGASRRAVDPEQVAGYKLLRAIGRGGMGTVYEAEDSDFGRRVALKLIAADSAASHEAVERFRQEGRLASAITHPRCVFVLAADEADGRPYIVMELMPGSTLQTLVEQRGALPLEEAIPKILDVIEGLHEAHSLGVIHRDVKPSNCFLEPDGRVKIGDFGLAKSLATNLQLTRTRTFLGTPLYASPEQIKGEALDARTDVYSTAATLYYLLAGRPPFFEGDAAAVLARIVSEPAPLLRSLKPEILPSLEAAVARGLDRDRERRWRDMGEFRAALLPFLPSLLGRGRFGLRVLAFLVDCALFPVLIELVFFVTLVVFSYDLSKAAGAWRKGLAITLGLTGIAWVPYFAILEGIWGRSLGKKLAGLRVMASVGGGPPGLLRSILRTTIVFIFIGLPADLALWLIRPETFSQRLVVFVTAAAAGALALGLTLWAGDGDRAAQDWLTGTRVLRSDRHSRKRAPRARRTVRSDRAVPVRAVGVLEHVGPFRVRGAVRWDSGRKVLLAEDSSLGREVWIVLRPRVSPPPDSARRSLSRHSRTRWLSGGEQHEGRWDAFVPPSGCPLADLTGRDGLPWHEARAILHDLAGELAAACADGTLPETLGVEQVWVQPDGSVQLVDALGPAANSHKVAVSDRERALELLRESAAVALEGGRRRIGAPLTMVRAPVPGHARRMLDRLVGKEQRYETIEPFLKEMEATRDLPDEVDSGRRAIQLAVAAAALTPGLAFLAYAGYTAPRLTPNVVAVLLAFPAIWIIWPFCFRGGLGSWMAGITPVGSDGKAAGRLRCAWRAFLIWAPFTLLLIGSVWFRSHGFSWVGRVLWATPFALLPIYAFLALLDPGRSPVDRLSGTHQVPR